MPFHKSVDMLFRGRQDLSFDGRKVLTLEQEKNRANRRVRGILFYISISNSQPGLTAQGAGKRTGANYLQISGRIRHDI